MLSTFLYQQTEKLSETIKLFSESIKQRPSAIGSMPSNESVYINSISVKKLKELETGQWAMLNDRPCRVTRIVRPTSGHPSSNVAITGCDIFRDKELTVQMAEHNIVQADGYFVPDGPAGYKLQEEYIHVPRIQFREMRIINIQEAVFEDGWVKVGYKPSSMALKLGLDNDDTDKDGWVLTKEMTTQNCLDGEGIKLLYCAINHPESLSPEEQKILKDVQGRLRLLKSDCQLVAVVARFGDEETVYSLKVESEGYELREGVF